MSFKGPKKRFTSWIRSYIDINKCFGSKLLVSGSLTLLCSMAWSQPMFSTTELNRPQSNKTHLESKFTLRETPIFYPSVAEGNALFENGYAEYRIQDSQNWPPQNQNMRPTKVTVVFTKYPKDQSFWLTDYHWLLAKRLKELFNLDSTLNDTAIVYELLLQTACDNEFEAQQMFHGIEVNYEPLASPILVEEEIAEKAPQVNSTYLKKLERTVRRYGHGADSSTIKTLERNGHWQNALLVLDWTGSMYGHSGEALIWHALQADSTPVKGVVIFNDGDGRPTRRKTIGATGGIYSTEALPISKPVKLLNKVRIKGQGGDSPENDIEAMIYGLAAYENVDQIILIADNKSCMRDYPLAGCVNKPVRVILCGAENGINPQYVNLAWRTGGSVHAGKLDIYDINEKVKQNKLVVAGVKFHLAADGQLRPVDRGENAYRFCDKYNTPSKRIMLRGKRKAECYFTD